MGIRPELRMPPRFPEVRVTLRTDNRWAVASAIRQALRRAGKDRAEIDRFVTEAMAAMSAAEAADGATFEEVCKRWVQYASTVTH